MFPKGESLGYAEAGFFYRLDALPAQPTVPKHSIGK